MVEIFEPVQSVSPSSKEGCYIYSILSIRDQGLVALTSEDEIHVLTQPTLKTLHTYTDEVPKRASCIARCPETGLTLACAGGDWLVSLIDVRSIGRIAQFSIGD